MAALAREEETPGGWEPLEGRDAESRRRFLRGAGLVSGAAVVAGLGGHWLAGRRGVSAAREAVTLPAPATPAPPVPAGADLSLPGSPPTSRPTGTSTGSTPRWWCRRWTRSTWRLRIHGRVRNPIELSFDELLARPMVERYVTLACVSNEVGGDLIGNARWLGVPLKDLLARPTRRTAPTRSSGASVDGWTCGTPTSVLRDGRDALLAVGMNGEPLPIEHGFPVRMVVPGLYGYVSACKWVTELELTSFADFDAYWVPRGWSAQAPGQDAVPDRHAPRGSRARRRPVTVAGVAWAQHRGIRRRRGTGRRRPLARGDAGPGASSDTWVQWSWRWDATPGEHTLEVRATDAAGEMQPGGGVRWRRTVRRAGTRCRSWSADPAGSAVVRFRPGPPTLGGQA